MTDAANITPGRCAAEAISSQMRLTTNPSGTRKYGPKIVSFPFT